MDFDTLVRNVGLWPALVVLLGWWVDKLRREQIAYRDRVIEAKEREIADLRGEAHKTVEAKNAELTAKNAKIDEMTRIALETRRRP